MSDLISFRSQRERVSFVLCMEPKYLFFLKGKLGEIIFLLQLKYSSKFEKVEYRKTKVLKNPIRNNFKSLQSIQRDYLESVELNKIIYINGSSTSNLNQGFSFLNSLKNNSLAREMFLSQEKLLNFAIPTAFSKNFAGIFNFHSYDESISHFGALKMGSVLDFVSSSSITS